jgi:hypothetical protein
MKMHTFKLFQISNNLVLNSNKLLYDRNLVSKVGLGLNSIVSYVWVKFNAEKLNSKHTTSN